MCGTPWFQVELTFEWCEGAMVFRTFIFIFIFLEATVKRTRG